MNILITGSNGFVARNLAKNLKDYNLTLTNRSNLNLLNSEEVKQFFKDKYFDVVIHTATTGGSRLKDDENTVFYENCIMHQNILDNSLSFDKYISFGSGAELDRRYNIDFSTDLKCAHPIDPYGMSKNLCERKLIIAKDHILKVFADNPNKIYSLTELMENLPKTYNRPEWRFVMNYLVNHNFVNYRRIHQIKFYWGVR
jgi:nucleoside-diphosphate-sugar epimerase